ncbi:unnamed protein product [Didymodactylos carnosus]|uniref:Alpha-glucosidase n=1 Tax=Didymodactylos carnosus TaxID=1234261 RepID=A0A8S2NQ95_9BILA|nr:unnamed protein product [Didymodactylos carnosus]CAF4011501.1 unnamed protein product [Didymodactylos carnosus]
MQSGLRLTFTLDKNNVDIDINQNSYIQSIIEDEDIVKEIWFRIKALPFNKESIYGCGQQYKYSNLRGKTIPIWVSEQYHERLDNGAGSSLLPKTTTYHPEPSFISPQRGYVFVAYGSAYARFDFQNEHYHQLHFTNTPYRLRFFLKSADSDYLSFLKRLAPHPLPTLPDWVHSGIILSIQGGTETVEQKMKEMVEAGTAVAGIWVQDWCGKRITSFGKRVFWNWQYSDILYHNLPEKIQEWKRLYNSSFLAYINPYIAIRQKIETNEIYQIDFGEFFGAIIDLTFPLAFEWYKNVIRKNLIDIEVSGWMADFGEYLPVDVRVHANISGELIHNLWSVLWAKCNFEAIRDAGKTEEVVFFMRAGYLGIQKYCPLFWSGDQSVDFASDDGFPAAIRSMLNLGVSGGCLYTHSDIGGYFGFDRGDESKLIRSKELLFRWSEMGAFNAFLRTHEGNRPDLNVQFDHDNETKAFMARTSRIYAYLKPYVKRTLQEGIPSLTPMWIHFNDLEQALSDKYELQYMFGTDLLVAPVVRPNVRKWTVYIPSNEDWLHLWSNEKYNKGEWEIDAPLGKVPVFYRATSQWSNLFKQLSNM